ncbi:MAG: hypothetical protein U0793_11500 [Gemmataceae bacterium]
MSRHVSRKSRWTQVSAKEYRSSFGVVTYRAGAWEGRLVFMRWNIDTDSWRPETLAAGRFKRPRNAMICVEDKAIETQRRYGDDVKVALL